MSDIVPYVAELLGDPIYTRGLSVRLESGAVLSVVEQEGHPEGTGEKKRSYIHRIDRPFPDGRTTRLVFTLSPEACCALAVMYAEHGIVEKVIAEHAAPAVAPQPKETGGAT